MQPITLLDFQSNAVNTLKNMLLSATASASRILLQSATGSGKTVIAGKLIEEVLALTPKDFEILVLVNLQVLIPQTYDTLRMFGIKPDVLHDMVTQNKHGHEMPYTGRSRVLVTMPETFHNTIKGMNDLTIRRNFKPRLILIDEAHKGTSEIYQWIRDQYPDAKIVGLTATPHREQSKEGEELADPDWYGNNLITTVSVQDLIDMGRLVRPCYHDIKDGERAHLLKTWKRVVKGSKNKRSIIFTRDSKASVKVLEAFTQAGIKAEIITSVTDEELGLKNQLPKVRQAIYNRFESGETTVLISVEALCEGFDCPAAKFCFLYRSVGNVALFHQMIGRVLRSWTDPVTGEVKDRGVVVDFFGNIKKHGIIELYQWSLSEPKKIEWVDKNDKIPLVKSLRRDILLHTCTGDTDEGKCGHIYNVRNHRCCEHCQTPHGVQVATTVGEVVQNLSITVDSVKALNALFASARGAISTGNKALMASVNKRAGVNMLDVEKGCLSDEFLLVKDMLGEPNLKLNKKINLDIQ